MGSCCTKKGYAQFALLGLQTPVLQGSNAIAPHPTSPQPHPNLANLTISLDILGQAHCQLHPQEATRKAYKKDVQTNPKVVIIDWCKRKRSAAHIAFPLLHIHPFLSTHSYPAILNHPVFSTHRHSPIPIHPFFFTHSYSPIHIHPFSFTHSFITQQPNPWFPMHSVEATPKQPTLPSNHQALSPKQCYVTYWNMSKCSCNTFTSRSLLVESMKKTGNTTGRMLLVQICFALHCICTYFRARTHTHHNTQHTQLNYHFL